MYIYTHIYTHIHVYISFGRPAAATSGFATTAFSQPQLEYAYDNPNRMDFGFEGFRQPAPQVSAPSGDGFGAPTTTAPAPLQSDYFYGLLAPAAAAAPSGIFVAPASAAPDKVSYSE